MGRGFLLLIQSNLLASFVVKVNLLKTAHCTGKPIEESTGDGEI